MSRASTFWLLAAMIALTAAGCSAPTQVEIANPASVYCADRGFQSEVRTDADGNQYGMCIFPDGSECEEWAFFRGECGLEYTYCAQQGYTPEIQQQEGGSTSVICRFPDGATCPELDYLNGSCTYAP